MIGIAVSLFAAVLFAGIIRILVKNLLLRHEVRMIPGWKGLPVVGCTMEMKPDPVEYFQQCCTLCKSNADAGIAKIWVGTVLGLFVFRAHTVEELYKSAKHIKKNSAYDYIVPWLGEGLLISDGDKWSERRRLITPTFHFKILEEFAHVFNEQASILVRLLKTKANGSEFDIQPYIFHCMLDVICETAMGVKINAQEQTESEFVKTIYSEAELVLHRMKYPWLWPDSVYQFSPTGRHEKRNLKVLHGFTRKVIAERKGELQRHKVTKVEAELTKSSSSAKTTTTADESDDEKSIYLSKKKRRLAFLDMLLEAAETNPSLTVRGIQEEVDTFMFEGHDTTATGAVWVLYMLACYPELQARVQEEIDSVLGDSDGDVTIEDASKLKYTECFIKETFRLYPPVVWFGRETSEACQIGGFSIPKGTSVSVMNNVLHRDPKYFPDPEKFDPDRWLSDSTASRHPYCYTPFSAGLRNCIGQRFAMLEEKVVLCHLMRNFTVTTSAKRDDIVVVATFILKPAKAMPIQLIARK